MANTLAYYDTATITAVKSFIVQAPVLTSELQRPHFVKNELCRVRDFHLSLIFAGKDMSIGDSTRVGSIYTDSDEQTSLVNKAIY